MKVFSKRHPEEASEVHLKLPIRQRIWYLFEEADPYFNPSESGWDLCGDALADQLKKEHGWQELRSYKSKDEFESVSTMHFILGGVPRFVLDAMELFHDLLKDETTRNNRASANPGLFQSKLNTIFEDADLPWRMLDGRIIKVDSKWLETEIHGKAAELLSTKGFEGALAEFKEARADLSSQDYKGAINSANLALESTIKSILGIEHEKPGALFRKLIESGLVPDYHHGFLKAFEEHVLRAVPAARNFEKGVGHGQGASINVPAKSLAEFAVNLSGVMILFLVKRHLEKQPAGAKEEPSSDLTDDIPF